jgi:predicted anti-sigma-YlaC factor YlaD
MKHYTEADLLETRYLAPGASMPVMMHLADCSECAARFERLEQKLRGLAACDTDRPATFWARQRQAVMHRVQASPRATSTQRPRLAIAAAFAAALTGLAVFSGKPPDVQNPPAAVPVSAAPLAATTPSALTTPEDLWQTDEQLESFQSMVAWESWDAAAVVPEEGRS